MKCAGRFIYRGIEKKDAGSFTNDNGQTISYDSSYQVKLDEIVDGKPQERKFKFPTKEKKLADSFNDLEPYSKCEITFNVNIFANSIRLIPLEVIGIND